MESIRPDNTDPDPVAEFTARMGTIMIRFVGLLSCSRRGAGVGLEPLIGRDDQSRDLAPMVSKA